MEVAFQPDVDQERGVLFAYNFATENKHLRS